MKERKVIRIIDIVRKEDDMTDKEKIKTEIERQIELNNNIDPITTAQQLVVDSVNAVLTDLLEFINSLPEEPVSEYFDALDQLLAKYAIDFSYKGKTLKECSGIYKAEIIATANHLEPVSEDLEEACEQLAENARKHKAETLSPFFSQWDYKQGVIDGAKWQKEHLWKPAYGDDLPIIDREVIALLNNDKVVFAHRPPEYWDGKNIVTGKVTRNYPKTYDKGVWNIPNVKYWLDCSMPKEIEL